MACWGDRELTQSDLSQTLKETGLSLRRKWDTLKRGRASAGDCAGPAGARLRHPFLCLSVLLLVLVVSGSLGFTGEAGREINSLSSYLLRDGFVLLISRSHLRRNPTGPQSLRMQGFSSRKELDVLCSNLMYVVSRFR